MQVENPFEEEVAPSRRLQSAVPPSKHRAGRQPKMSDSAKRRRARAVRARIAAYLDQKAVANG